MQLLAVGDKINAIRVVREATSLGLKEAKDLVESGAYAGKAAANEHTVASAEAYLYAGRACYLQQKLPQAVAHAGNAYRLVPEFVEAGFEQAKYLAANSQDDEAAAVLQAVISKDRYFAVKTLTDADLATKTPVLKLLGDLQAKPSRKRHENSAAAGKLLDLAAKRVRYSRKQSAICRKIAFCRR